MTEALPKPRGRILITLLLLLIAIGVVPLLWTSFTLSKRSREIMVLDQKSSQLDKARGLSRQVALYVQGLRGSVSSIARALEVGIKPATFRATVEQLRASRGLESYVKASEHLYSVNVLDTGCVGTGSGMQLPDQEVQQLLQQGCQVARQGEALSSPPIMAASLKEHVMILAEPIRAAGSVQGSVVAVATLSPIWKMTREMAGGTAEVYVVDDRGRLVAHSDTDKALARADMSGIEIVKAFVASRGRSSQTVPFTISGPEGSQRMLGTFTAVPDDSGWGVIAQVNEDKAFHDANEMWRWSRLLVATVAIVALGLGTLFAGRISRPIQDLARGAQRLAAGEYSTRVRVSASNEVGVLAGAFNHMGAEIEKAIEEIREAARTNKELFMGSIKMLANAIDEKDVYTRGHSERVGHYSQVIAQHLALSAEEVERIYISGILHDVGKIGIEDRILRKPAALTDDEFEMMKEHPKKGEHILSAVPLLHEIAGAGLMHHENIDGSGYPDGLKGDQIPLYGRIVSVADAFDAMTTDRPYSKAMTDERAIARLRELSGKKFDLACVEAMERAVAAGDLTTAKARLAAVKARKAS